LASLQNDAVQNLQEHSFDTIVGTDVVFAPALVEPLLETLRIHGTPGYSGLSLPPNSM
jgi:hypothetical protein